MVGGVYVEHGCEASGWLVEDHEWLAPGTRARVSAEVTPLEAVDPMARFPGRSIADRVTR